MKNWRGLVREHSAVSLLLLCFGGLYSFTLDAYGMFLWDEAEYASLGRSLLRGEGFSISERPNALRPPLLPLSAAASMLLFDRSDDIIVRLPSLFFSLLALLVVYQCVKMEFDRPTGLVAAALLGLFPSFWRATPFLLTEIPFMAFFTGAVLYFYFGLYRQRRYFFWSWLCWGLAFLTRYTALLFGPIVVLFLVPALCIRDQEVRRRIWSTDFFLSPLAGLGIMLPWFIRQYLTFGDALIGIKQSATQLQSYMPDLSMPWYFYCMRLPTMLSPSLIAFLLLGIAWAVWKRERFTFHCLIVCIAIVVWFSCYRYKELRLVTSILPFMAVPTAVGVMKPIFPTHLTWRSAVALTLLLSSIFIANFSLTRPTFQRTVLGYPLFLEAMQFLHEQTAPDAVIVGANFPQIYWYADRRAINFPDEQALRKILEQSEWIVIINFEPAQKDYVYELAKKVTFADAQAGNVAYFRDSRFVTLLIRSSLLRKRL